MTSCVLRSLQFWNFWIPRAPGPQNLDWRRLDVSWSYSEQNSLAGALVKALHCRMFMMFAHFDCQLDCDFFAPGKTITSRASLRISKSSLCRSLRRSPRSVTPSCPRCDVVLSCADCAGLAAPASVQLRRCSDTGAQSTVVGCSYPWWNSGNNAKGVRGIFARD